MQRPEVCTAPAPKHACRWRLGLLAWLPLAALAQDTRPAPPPDPGGLVRVAMALLEYTRWPGPPRPLQLCLATAGPFGRDLRAAVDALPDPQPRLLPRELPVDQPPPADCDVLVMGGWQDGPARSTLAQLQGRPVLSLGMGGQACAQGAAFCLLPNRPTGSRFAANADVIRRSGLTVNARALQLARPPETGP